PWHVLREIRLPIQRRHSQNAEPLAETGQQSVQRLADLTEQLVRTCRLRSMRSCKKGKISRTNNDQLSNHLSASVPCRHIPQSDGHKRIVPFLPRDGHQMLDAGALLQQPDGLIAEVSARLAVGRIMQAEHLAVTRHSLGEPA